jgi:branched-chain amino acid aminotransferase
MAIHRYILQNGVIRDAAEPALTAGQLGLLAGWGVFSTLRVVEGTLFAWERHWARMQRDARLLNVPMPPDPDELEQDLRRLVEANGQPSCTLRVVVVRNTGGVWQGPCASGSPVDVIALTAPAKAWGTSVRLGIQPNARYAAGEFAGAKILSWAQNLRWAERAQEQGFDEVILLNERTWVAECTSANIFAVFGARVFTPPLTEGCLPGVTREVLLTEVSVPGVTVIERGLTVESLFQADRVFITSTTRDLLPVREIVPPPGFDGAGEARTLNQRGDVPDRLAAAFRAFVAGDVARRAQQFAPSSL